jgi:SNF2 family DNA or RNA helicase
MGLGKTVCTLSAIRILIDHLDIQRALVVAPKKVAETTWAQECQKWDHLKDLRTATVMGPEAQRMKALETEADIYVTSRDNVAWLVSLYDRRRHPWPFDMVVLDELSSFKNAQSHRFRALRSMRPDMWRIVGLTGTPAPNGLIDLWPQIYLLDQGERLGRTLGAFRTTYFTPGRGNGHIVYDYRLRPGADKAISAAISDICISMKAADYLTLPERIDKVQEVQLPQAVRQGYEDFERTELTRMDGEEIEASSAAALSVKLRQWANGALYDEARGVHRIHDEKVAALREIMEAAGSPVLVFYQFRHDADRILQALAAYEPQLFTGGAETLEAWNAGRIPLLLAHPASTAYGLNMQAGGHICVWYGVDWNLELYQQANARLHRQGQQHPVTIIHLVAKGTIDEDIMKALQGKRATQDALLAAVKARIAKYINAS